MVVDSIVGTLISQAVNKVIAKMDESKKQIRTVIVQEKPDSYSYTEIDRATSTNQKWQKNADLEFENSLKKQSKVREISLVPDTVFKTKGKVIITIDDVPVFRTKGFDSFTDPDYSKIKINTTINRDEKVKVFLLSSDGSSISLTAQVTFGD